MQPKNTFSPTYTKANTKLKWRTVGPGGEYELTATYGHCVITKPVSFKEVWQVGNSHGVGIQQDQEERDILAQFNAKYGG